MALLNGRKNSILFLHYRILTILRTRNIGPLDFTGRVENLLNYKLFHSFGFIYYVSASIKVASSLASAEQMRVVRMFIKHSHYFANACHQGSVYLPAAMKVDIFSSKMNKILLCAYFGKAIDHWPYDA